MSPSVRRTLLILFTAVALAFVGVVAALGIAIHRAAHPRRHRFTLAAQATLSESVAVNYTRRALELEGRALSASRPVPYWLDSNSAKHPEGDRLFARNTINPDQGYVLWSSGDHVTIERYGEVVECRVYRPK